jgi:hypothetical protein
MLSPSQNQRLEAIELIKSDPHLDHFDDIFTLICKLNGELADARLETRNALGGVPVTT